jgi:hypothetical protein
MIHKKGDLQDSTNYSPIVLVSSLKKIYEGLLRSSLLKHVATTQCLHQNQFAFITSHHTKEAIFLLHQTIQTRAHRDSALTYVAFPR